MRLALATNPLSCVRFVESDLAAVLGVPAFPLMYAISRGYGGIGQSMLQASLRGRSTPVGTALDLAAVGLVRFRPALSLSLVSGAVVDTYRPSPHLAPGAKPCRS